VAKPVATPLIAVAVGGACGAMLRHGAYQLVPAPWDLLSVNFVGTMLLIWLKQARPLPSVRLHTALTTGLCGALTTVSSLAWFTMFTTVDAHDGGGAAQYVLITLVATLFPGWILWQYAERQAAS